MRNSRFIISGRRFTLLLIETCVLMAGVAAVIIVGLPILHLGA
jgi:hypothetical protein